MRLLGIDYGDARIGFAENDLLDILAVPLFTYKSCGMRRDVDYIANLVLEKKIDLIVLGLPLNMDGTSGLRAEKTKRFGGVLEKVTGLPIIYQDERLTTVSAHEILDSLGKKKDKHKDLVDTISAQLILQSYMDSIKRRI